MVVRTVKNTVKVVIGVILVVIGIIGGLIPIFQGWIFGIPGLLLLSSVFPPLRKWLEHMKEKIKQKMTTD
ncbi:MAG: hypothetical protein IIB95_12595 [Candidatus Marinimicrobia bacterium]|nr:hypothetical protein [Candidatus Neomarinimicrobiota bacterium]MCH7764553.1 hypothetical protein [Candidatus Neomarinimicrobiota bacterium]